MRSIPSSESLECLLIEVFSPGTNMICNNDVLNMLFPAYVCVRMCV